VAVQPEKVLNEFIVSAARTGDRSAFDRLAHQWQPRLIAHAYRMSGDKDLARDITQDAWIDIIRGIRRLKDVRAFPSWAFMIVSRRAADAIKRRQSSRRLKSAMDAEPRDNDGVLRDTEARADRSSLSEALRELPREQRVVMALFYLEELTTREIATALNIPPGTVKTRLMHGRNKMRVALEVKGDLDHD